MNEAARLKEIIGDYQTFLRHILEEVVAEGFALDDFVQMDHMCYRVPTFAQYEQKKQELLQVSTLLGEAQVNGRPISSFRVHTPVRHKNWRIDCIELPAPKEGADTSEGLEHVEFVLYDDKETFLKKYSHKTFELKAADRGINPEIAYKLPHYVVKFHLLNLPTVVYLEQKLGMTDIRDGH